MAKKTCTKCGKKIGFLSTNTIRGENYCNSCALNVPSCDKCKYHTSYSDHRYGECQFHQQWLQDYDNVCEYYKR